MAWGTDEEEGRERLAARAVAPLGRLTRVGEVEVVDEDGRQSIALEVPVAPTPPLAPDDESALITLGSKAG